MAHFFFFWKGLPMAHWLARSHDQGEALEFTPYGFFLSLKHCFIKTWACMELYSGLLANAICFILRDIENYRCNWALGLADRQTRWPMF